MTTEVGCGEAVWMTGQRRWGQWGGGSRSPLDGSRVQAALGDSQCLAPPLTLSFAAGCAQSEVHRLFRVSVSGFPLGKDVSDGSFPRALPSTAAGQREPPRPAGLHLPPPGVGHQHSLLHPLDPPPLRDGPPSVLCNCPPEAGLTRPSGHQGKSRPSQGAKGSSALPEVPVSLPALGPSRSRLLPALLGESGNSSHQVARRPFRAPLPWILPPSLGWLSATPIVSPLVFTSHWDFTAGRGH